jgi:hypothetical protein
MADMRVLPGMEGGPVTDACGALVGALWLPLYSGQAGAEVPLIMPAGVLAAALAVKASGWRPSDGTGASAESPSQTASEPFVEVNAIGLRERHAAEAQSSTSAGPELVPVGVSGQEVPAAAEARRPADPQRRRLAAVTTFLRPAAAAATGPPLDLAPALALARRGVVGVVAAGGRWASGIVVNP